NTLPTQAFCAEPDDLLPAPAANPRACYCGRRDCIEQWVCGPGFERSYTLLTGESVKAEVISARHQAGQTEATATLRNYANLLALSLATVINIVDPDCIVLGGGLSNIQALYRLLPDYLPNYVFSDQVDTRIVPAKFGDSSGVRGAAWLWPGAPV
ncbi:MAG: ROK family protein, partial [Pseudomonadales bacterium]|nr:ROK family protein [Pseudomonadales bacterium]